MDKTKLLDVEKSNKISIKTLREQILKIIKSILLFMINHSVMILCIAIAGILAKNFNSSHIDSLLLIVKSITDFFVSLLNFSIKIWVLLLFFILIILTIYQFQRMASTKSLNYNEDIIDSIKWKYTLKNPDNFINDLQSYCSICGCELSLDGLKSYYCQNCNRKFGPEKNDEDIKKIIRQRIEEKSGK